LALQYRLEFDRHAETAAGLLGHIDIEADELILVIAKTHGWEVVVQADNDLGGRVGAGSRGRFFLAARRKQRHGRNQE